MHLLYEFFQVSYLNFERQPSSIAAVGIANGMMVSCNKLRSGFENVGSVTGTFYPPVASPHDQSLQHYTSSQSSKTANYSMQSTVENNYNPVQCANRQQSMGIRGAAEGCSGNSWFIFISSTLLHLDRFQRSRIFKILWLRFFYIPTANSISFYKLMYSEGPLWFSLYLNMAESAHAPRESQHSHVCLRHHAYAKETNVN